MLTFIFIPAILIFIAIRLIFRPLWNPYRIRRPYYGHYGYYGYGRGYRRHWLPGGLLFIAALLALDRIFGRRW